MMILFHAFFCLPPDFKPISFAQRQTKPTRYPERK